MSDKRQGGRRHLADKRKMASTSTAPNLDGILLLEAPFARVPHDELRRQLRTQQRLVERELTLASTAFDTAAKALAGEVNGDGDAGAGNVEANGDTSMSMKMSMPMSTSTSSTSDIERSLDGVIGRLKGLKRKVRPSCLCL